MPSLMQSKQARCFGQLGGGGGGGGGGVVWRGAEPIGYTLESDQPWNSLPSNGWAGFFSFSIVSDAAGPQSPNNAFQILYPAGFAGGDSPGLAECGLAGRKKLYVCMALKFSSNWQGHLTGVNKIIHFWVGGSNHLFLLANASGTGPLLVSTGIQGVVTMPYGDGFSVQQDANLVAGAKFIRGQFHQLEMVAVANSAGVANGTVDLWLDGVHVSALTGIEFTAAAPTWDDVKLDPTWGGLGGTVSADMSLRVDHIYMSSSN